MRHSYQAIKPELNADFTALQQLGQSTGIIIAVSGGSDSLGLLFLTRDYLQAMRPDIRMLAVTVDHHLRAASAQEAAEVASLCAAHNIPHETLHWTGEKPQSGLAAAGRVARYGLLMQAAEAHDATLILTGHTADDQVETFLMRRERLKALDNRADNRANNQVDNQLAAELPVRGLARGLAGMAVQTRLNDRYIVLRPLLSLWRQDLRNYLQTQGISWVDDPSNVNLTYERPRVRLEADRLDKPNILAEAAGYAAQRQAANQRLVTLLATGREKIYWLAGGCLKIDVRWLESDPDAALLALQYCVTLIGGRRFLPSQSKAQGKAEPLGALLGGAENLRDTRRLTLHGCVIEQKHDALYIWRENRNLPVQDLNANQSLIWDQRYWLDNQTDMDLCIRCPSSEELAQFCRKHTVDRRQFHRNAVLSSPAIYRDEELIALPVMQAGLHPLMALPEGISWRQHFSCFDQVLSGHDFTLSAVLKASLTMASNHKCS